MQLKHSQVHEILEALRDNGNLKLLFDLGFISWKTYMYLDICDHYNNRIIMGDGKMAAVYNTAEKFNVDITTVYRSLKKLQYECSDFNTNDKRKKKVSGSSIVID